MISPQRKKPPHKERPLAALLPLNAPLSPHWAFVVQLREGTALTPEALHGRVEHIVSGQATLFASLEELMLFMAHALTAQEKEKN